MPRRTSAQRALDKAHAAENRAANAQALELRELVASVRRGEVDFDVVVAFVSKLTPPWGSAILRMATRAWDRPTDPAEIEQTIEYDQVLWRAVSVVRKRDPDGWLRGINDSDAALELAEAEAEERGA